MNSQCLFPFRTEEVKTGHMTLFRALFALGPWKNARNAICASLYGLFFLLWSLLAKVTRAAGRSWWYVLTARQTLRENTGVKQEVKFIVSQKPGGVRLGIGSHLNLAFLSSLQLHSQALEVCRAWERRASKTPIQKSAVNFLLSQQLARETQSCSNLLCHQYNPT